MGNLNTVHCSQASGLYVADLCMVTLACWQTVRHFSLTKLASTFLTGRCLHTPPARTYGAAGPHTTAAKPPTFYRRTDFTLGARSKAVPVCRVRPKLTVFQVGDITKAHTRWRRSGTESRPETGRAVIKVPPRELPFETFSHDKVSYQCIFNTRFCDAVKHRSFSWSLMFETFSAGRS